MMQNLFQKLVELSLAGSVFALAVMLVRLVFRKAPRWIFCLLWGVVALRLILPVSIQSSVSLVPVPVASGRIITDAAERYIGNVDVHYENSEAYTNAIDAGRQPAYSNNGYYVVTEKGTLDEPATVGDTLFPILSRVWLAGMAAMLSYLVISYLIVLSSMKEATRLRENVFQCEKALSPFVLGLLRPKIYLPYHMDEGDRANVIAHERAHILRKDHWWKPIGFLLLCVHWFNPVMWLVYILLCRDIEAACDEKVIRHMDREEMRAYSTALLRCSIHRRRVTACPLAFGEVGVKERIRHVMNYKKPAFWIVALVVIASMIVGILLLTEPVTQEGKDWVETTEPTSTTNEKLLQLVDQIVNNQQCAASSNPFDYINAGKNYYNEILTYGEAAVDTFVAQLREGENGLRGYVMAVACAELTGIGDKKEGADWATAQQWLSLYNSGKNQLSLEIRPSEITPALKEELDEGIRILDITSASNESKLTMEISLGKTDLSQPGQSLMNRISSEWKRYDSMSALDRLASSHLWGTIYINTDAWSECENQTGVAVYNPLEAVDWIDQTGYFGDESANPDIPVTHVQAVAYAPESNERQLSHMDITAGYNFNGLRITLTASVCGMDSLFTTGSVRQGYATFENEATATGSGLPAVLVTPNEENTGQYNADYYDQMAYWIDGNVFYTLRIVGEKENQSEIQKTLEKLLAEI